MTSVIIYLLCLTLLKCVYMVYGRFSEHDVSMTVLHSFDPKSSEFVECGLYNFYFGNAELKQQCLTPNVRSYIQEHAHIDHAYYRMKILLKVLEKEHMFYTFIPFNQLAQFNFHYSLKISIDDNMVPMAITAKVLNSAPKALLGDSSYIDVYFQHMSQGPQPDTATFIHKMEREREAKEKGANQDNRSFLAKYWIYILPLLIFAVLSGSVNADGNGAQR